MARERANFSDWVATGDPKKWVRQHNLRWNHQDWLALLESLRHSKFWPMDPDAIGAALDAAFASIIDDEGAEMHLKGADQWLLAKVALTCYSRRARLYAVERVVDQSVLAEVAMRLREDGPGEFGATYDSHNIALKRLTDQGALAMVAKRASELYIRQEAVGMITDQAVLAEVATTEEHQPLCHQIVSRLFDPAPLAMLAKAARSEFTQIAAVEKIGDQTLLAEIAKTHEYNRVRIAAMKKVTNYSVLADVNARRTFQGSTMLMLASEMGHHGLVHELLNRGANVNAEDNVGSTALIYASIGGSAEIVRLLLLRGADPNVTTKTGWTALTLARNADTKMLLQQIEWERRWRQQKATFHCYRCKKDYRIEDCGTRSFLLIETLQGRLSVMFKCPYCTEERVDYVPFI